MKLEYLHLKINLKWKEKNTLKLYAAGKYAY